MRISHFLLIFAALTACVSLAAADNDAAAAGGDQAVALGRLPRMELQTPGRARSFYVETPDGTASRAWREDLDFGPKGAATQRAGRADEAYVLTQRVIVKSDDLAALRDAVQNWPRTSVRRMSAVSGYAIVTAASVRDAAEIAEALRASGVAKDACLDVKEPISLRSLPTDPFFSSQWHLRNTIDPLFDLNTEAAWSLGYTGAGVVIGIVDTPVQVTHPDLAANYYPEASQDTDETPDVHGTECAGVAAAVANNGANGASVAYGARFSRQVIGTDAENADALAFRRDLNDIKSNSWGPFDTGSVNYMPAVVDEALRQGIHYGRGGRGTVFVWASGNGGEFDRADYDPYVASRFTISVGAIGDLDTHADYSEGGSSLMLVAFSDGNTRQIYSLKNHSGQTFTFGGTSAACPQVSGVAALMLEANPDLTWRDVRQVLIDTARKNDPNDASWITNGAGREHSYVYGFGAVDAGAAVQAARTWRNLPHEVTADTGVVDVGVALPDNKAAGYTAQVTLDDDIRIEAIELTVNVTSTYIGDLRIIVTSPEGTASMVADTRVDSQDDYVNYTFTSFRSLGEHSSGVWTVKMADRAAGDLSTWQDFQIRVYGSPICPGDFDRNGERDLPDLVELLSVYGMDQDNPEFPAEVDIFNDGRIDLSDLGLFLSEFGTTCPD